MSASSGQISLRLAMSLDGYIADDQGGYDWIVPVASPALDTDHQLPFDEFLDGVDIVVMGRRCYDQGQNQDYVALGKRSSLRPRRDRFSRRRRRESTLLVMEWWRWSVQRETKGITASSSEAGCWL